jgi:hypothetical protein
MEGVSDEPTPPTAPPPPGAPVAQAGVQPGGPPPRKPFAQQSFGDMLRSMVVLVLIVGALWAVNSLLFSQDTTTPVRAVSYRGQLADARQMADYRVLAPSGLGASWVPTSVDVRRSGPTVRWHLGFLTPGREYVGLEQGDRAPGRIAAQYVADLRPSGALTIDGTPWRLYRGETDTALVRRDGRAGAAQGGAEGGAVTVVVGTAPTGQLVSFARSLR